VEGSLAGETIRSALDLTSWEAAENTILEWNRAGRIGGALQKSMGVREAADRYIADAEGRKLSIRSVDRYRAFLIRVVVPWCETEKIKEVRELNFAACAKFRASWTTWSSYTSAKNLELLRMFLRFCVRANWMEKNPAEELQTPKIKMAPTLPFTEEEETKILAACDLYKTHNKHGKRSPERLRAFVLTLRYSGLRIGDVATLSVSRLNENKLQLYTHKTGVMVFVPIPPFVADALRVQASLNPSSAYFFWTGESKVKCVTATWQRTLAGLFKKAGVPEGHAHRYRDVCRSVVAGRRINGNRLDAPRSFEHRGHAETLRALGRRSAIRTRSGSVEDMADSSHTVAIAKVIANAELRASGSRGVKYKDGSPPP